MATAYLLSQNAVKMWRFCGLLVGELNFSTKTIQTNKTTPQQYFSEPKPLFAC